MLNALYNNFSPTRRAVQLTKQGALATEVARQSLLTRTQQSRNAFFSVGMACITVGALYSFVMPVWRPLCWLTPLLFLEFAHWHFSQRSISGIEKFLPINIARAELYHTSATIILSAAIGAGVWWTGLNNDHTNIWYVTTTIQSIYAIGATSNIATHRLAAVFAIWTNLGSAALFWTTAGTSELGSAASLIALALFLTGYSSVIQRTFMELIRIRFENLNLVKKLEIEKEAAETARREAEQANLSKSQFLAAASHDLRQPLHALMLFSNLLDSSTTEQRKVLINHIRAAAESLNHLFSGLLDLSKLDAGAITPQLTNVNLAPLLESLGSEFGAKARQKGLEFEMQVTEIAAITDPFLVERVLRNLLDNAVKYTSQGFIKFSVLNYGATVKISVEDSGVGVDEQFQEQIFSEFFQLDNPARNSEHGTGLGLSIVRRLCDLMGHRRDLKSAPGVGSCFSIELLSAALPDAHNVRVGVIDHSALTDLRILIVDDDSRVRFAMERLLQSWHCQVITAASSSELMTLAATHELPNALIADYRLAENKTGFDVIRDARLRWPAIPAAIFTGDTEAHWREAESMTDVPIFQKPVEADQIARWLIKVTTTETVTPA